MAASEQSYWLKSGLLSILERGSVFIFGFGSIYFLARALSITDFGTWVLFGAFFSFIEVGRGGLLQNALVRYLSTCEEEEVPLISTASLMINLGLTVICILIFLLFAGLIATAFEAPILAAMLRIYCMTTLVLVPFQQFNFIQQANLDFRGIFMSNFVLKGTLFFYILGLYLSASTIGLIQLALCQIVAAVLAASVSFYFARPYLKFSRRIDWEWMRKLFTFGIFVFGTNLSAMLYKTIDKLMLGLLVPTGTIAVGVYEWAIKITNLVEVPTFSVASIVFPQSARKMKSEGLKAIKELYEQSVGAILAIILPFMLFVYLFTEPIIVFLASEKYLDTVPILQITIWFGLFIPFVVQFGTVLDSIGRPKINFFFTLFGMILNIALNYILISQMGIIGAAYATLSGYFILFSITQIVLNRMIGIWAPNVFGHILPFYVKAYRTVYEILRKKWVALKTEV
ncbi:MAG: flippase [Bacteroidota bacterium]